MAISYCKEFEEEAQIIINTALERLTNMGFGVIIDGATQGKEMLIGSLRVKRLKSEKSDKK